MKNIIFFILLLPVTLLAQKPKTENVIIFTLDGMRWEEVFGGIDSAIVVDKNFTRDSAEMVARFWSNDRNERRKKLFPFFWNSIATHGQLYGDRLSGSEVNNVNPYQFSYPGYK